MGTAVALWTGMIGLRNGVRRAQQVGIMLVDERYGPTRLMATFGDVPMSNAAVVMIHGLGADRSTGYMRRAARALQQEGLATLTVDLRGVDGQGGGVHHAAQIEDLRAACRAPVLRRFEHLFLLGFGMGGHVVLHLAAREDDRRVRAVAALCSPLDLQAAQQAFDRSAPRAYRRAVLRRLRKTVVGIARRHPDALLDPRAQRCQSLLEWDRLVVAPRYGYASPDAYYEDLSARHVLSDLCVDTTLVLARHDPVVPPSLALPYIGAAPVGKLRVCVLPRGGHLEFPRGQSLGGDAPASVGVVSQIAHRWCQLADCEALVIDG